MSCWARISGPVRRGGWRCRRNVGQGPARSTVRLAMVTSVAGGRRNGRRKVRSSPRPDEQHPLVADRLENALGQMNAGRRHGTIWRRWRWCCAPPRPPQRSAGKTLCSWVPSVPASSATRTASFIWPRICGSPMTIESRPLATRKAWRTASRAAGRCRGGVRGRPRHPVVFWPASRRRRQGPRWCNTTPCGCRWRDGGFLDRFGIHQMRQRLGQAFGVEGHPLADGERRRMVVDAERKITGSQETISAVWARIISPATPRPFSPGVRRGRLPGWRRREARLWPKTFIWRGRNQTAWPASRRNTSPAFRGTVRPR